MEHSSVYNHLRQYSTTISTGLRTTSNLFLDDCQKNYSVVRLAHPVKDEINTEYNMFIGLNTSGDFSHVQQYTNKTIKYN